MDMDYGNTAYSDQTKAAGLGTDHIPCNLLPSPNSTLPLARNWENIPETIILNGAIGTIMFVSFIFMTRAAYRRSRPGGNYDYDSQKSLLTFLYGYRDVESWYVVPRYEFLRRTDRHHKHDMRSNNLCIPPNMPVRNPLELFNVDETASRSNRDDSLDMDSVDKSQGPGARQHNLTSHMSKSSTSTTGREHPIVPLNKLLPQEVASSDSSQVPRSAKTISRLSLEQRAGSSVVTIDTTAASKSPPPPPPGTNNHQAPPQPANSAQQQQAEPTFFYPSILTAEQLQASYLSRRLNRFFSMFFRVTDADIIYAKGIDAYEYLLFQRHLILILFITNIFCLGIILPVHWFSSSNSATSFQRTTIKNMSQDSILYWAHITSSICIVTLALIILNSYKQSLVDQSDSQLSKRTLLVGNLPVEQRTRTALNEIFKKYFPRSQVEAIQFVYDIATIDRLSMQLEATIVAREYCEFYRYKHNQELMVLPTDVNEGQECRGCCRMCSFFYVCCCFWPRETKLPGTSYYRDKEAYYRWRLADKMEQLISNPSEYAFITLKSYGHAKRVMEKLTKLKSEVVLNEPLHHEGGQESPVSPAATGGSVLSKSKSANKTALTPSENSQATKAPAKSEYLVTGNKAPNDPLNVKNNPHLKSIRSPAVKRYDEKARDKSSARRGALDKSPKLPGPLAWSVRYAPYPVNVEWYDLLHIATRSKFTIALLHLLMFVIFIFVTTPNVLLSILDRWTILQPDRAKELTGFRAMFVTYLSTLIQIITTALLPYIIKEISSQIPFEDAASKTHSTMWKVYLFLVLMVIVMPSVGMSSAQAFLSTRINLECLFPTDNGAYFINYVISSMFLSTILELIKPRDIISYSFIYLTNRSRADFEGGRQYIEREFSVGMQHTTVMLVFSVVMTYAISCPIIAPAGLLYMVVKHAVDHYHLFYTYFTKKVDRNLQNTIDIFVKVALLLMLFQTTVAITINLGTSLFSLVSQIIFWISLAVFLFNCFFHYTSRAMISGERNRYRQEFCSCFYLPRVIEDLLRTNAIPEHCLSRLVQ